MLEKLSRAADIKCFIETAMNIYFATAQVRNMQDDWTTDQQRREHPRSQVLIGFYVT